MLKSSDFKKGNKSPAKDSTLPPPIKNSIKYDENADKKTIEPPEIIDGSRRGICIFLILYSVLAPRFLAHLSSSFGYNIKPVVNDRNI